MIMSSSVDRKNAQNCVKIILNFLQNAVSPVSNVQTSPVKRRTKNQQFWKRGG